jgi:predicted metallo-beta-lactamase superfamily hydrolase
MTTFPSSVFSVVRTFVNRWKSLIPKSTAIEELRSRLDIAKDAWRHEEFVLVPVRWYDDHLEFLEKLYKEIYQKS